MFGLFSNGWEKDLKASESFWAGRGMELLKTSETPSYKMFCAIWGGDNWSLYKRWLLVWITAHDDEISTDLDLAELYIPFWESEFCEASESERGSMIKMWVDDHVAYRFNAKEQGTGHFFCFAAYLESKGYSPGEPI